MAKEEAVEVVYCIITNCIVVTIGQVQHTSPGQ